MGKLIKHFFLKYRFILVTVIFLLLISFVGDHSLVNRVKQKQEIARLKEQIQEQVDQYAKDKDMLEKLKTDPEAVKRIAHEKYYMKTDNEDIFVIQD